MVNLKLYFALVIVLLTSHANSQTFSDNFSTGYDGWAGDFSDYPVTDSVAYELEFQRTKMPAPLDTAQYGLKISGNNHSDDLFMFIKKKISGLLPNTSYRVLINVDFASNAPTNAMGVGGAPGEGVTMKAGATLIEPIKVAGYLDHYWMNIDKGNQIGRGLDMDTIGHVGVSDTTTVFTQINRNNSTHQFSFITNSRGEIWICIGTDSGFEATTTIYYKKIDLIFTSTTGLSYNKQLNDIKLYPNPTEDIINVKIHPASLGQRYKITDPSGQQIMTGKLTRETSYININEIPAGMYFFTISKEKALKLQKK